MIFVFSQAMSGSPPSGQSGTCDCANGMADVTGVVTRETGEGIPIVWQWAAKYFMAGAVAPHRNFEFEYGGMCMSLVVLSMPLTLACNHRHWV